MVAVIELFYSVTMSLHTSKTAFVSAGKTVGTQLLSSHCKKGMILEINHRWSRELQTST